MPLWHVDTSTVIIVVLHDYSSLRELNTWSCSLQADLTPHMHVAFLLCLSVNCLKQHVTATSNSNNERLYIDGYTAVRATDDHQFDNAHCLCSRNDRDIVSKGYHIKGYHI